MSGSRRPLKSLGQNFLVDHNIINGIIRTASIKPDQAVLEIGPGRGALTEHLAERAGQLVLIEFDHALAAWHREKYRSNPGVSVIDGDILKVDLEKIMPIRPQGWNVVANLPYNISTEVLFRLLPLHDRLDRMTLMLQKEVGARLTASPDCSEYGVTSVLLGLWFTIRRAFIVSPGCFHPRPKIDSAVLSFVPLSEPRAEVGHEELFRQIVKAAFAMRRKTLFNCLKSADCTKNIDLYAMLEASGIDGQRRGETLSLDEFARLSRWLSESTPVNLP